MAPRLVELCFQTAGLWELGTDGRLGLPRHVDRVSVLRHPEEAGRLVAVAAPEEGSSEGSPPRFDAYVVDEHGNVYLILRGYGTVELSGAVEPEPLAALREELSARELAVKS
jgi:hypothetical protein